jgi:hypothetical protein
MATPQPDSFLLRLTHDVRLDIYSHIILPPFDGCRDYAGLFRACRQLKEEVDREATRQLQIYLHKISKDEQANSSDDSSAEVNGGEMGHHHSLEFINTSTVLGNPIVGVKVPFLLPPIAHDWHYQKYPLRFGCGVAYSSQPLSKYQIASIERDRQEGVYGKYIKQLLMPIRQLHKLHLTSIDIELIVDKNIATRIAEDTALDKRLDKYRPQSLLEATVIGRLLQIYMRRLSDQGFFDMAGSTKDCAFNTRIINVAWNFGSQKTTILQANYKSPTALWEGISSQVSSSEDHRKGVVQVMFNVEDYLQREISDDKRRLRIMETRERMGVCERDQEWINKLRSGLAKNREKLQKLGFAEGKDPELSAEEIKMTERMAAMMAEREARKKETTLS